MHQCAYIFAAHNAFEITHNIHIKDIDGEVVLFTHCCCGEVHNLQSTCINLVVGYVGKLSGR